MCEPPSGVMLSTTINTFLFIRAPLLFVLLLSAIVVGALGAVRQSEATAEVETADEVECDGSVFRLLSFRL